MLKKIIHIIIFLTIAGIVASSFFKKGGDEDVNSMMQLPVLMLAALYLGVLFVLYILPAITDKATTAVLDSGEMIEKDPLHDARAAYARGDYEEAIKVYKSVADNDPYNRLPWVEIAKIQHGNFENPDSAIVTLQQALESHEWPVNDAAFFMGRIAEIYLDDKGDQQTSIGILQQMIELFPETRHSANATHKINEIMRASEQAQV